MSVGESRVGKSWQRVSHGFSQAMRRRGGSVQRSWNLLGRGDADDVNNVHGRDDHVHQKGNRSQIELRYTPQRFAILLWRLRLERSRDRGKIWLDFKGAKLLARFYFLFFFLVIPSLDLRFKCFLFFFFYCWTFWKKFLLICLILCLICLYGSH